MHVVGRILYCVNKSTVRYSRFTIKKPQAKPCMQPFVFETPMFKKCPPFFDWPKNIATANAKLWHNYYSF